MNREKVRTIHREVDGFIGRIFGKSGNMRSISKDRLNQINPQNFETFTFSKVPHFQDFQIMPIYQRQSPLTCDLKVYQDLFVYSFILDNIPKGARVLEIGGGESRIIACLKDDYEFWNLDKLEGQGHGPKKVVKSEGFFLVRDYIGAFSNELPDQYFDLVYSISAVEHFSTDETAIDNILQDMKRLLNRNAYCLHCVDALIFDDHLWVHPIINKITSEITDVVAETDFEIITSDQDLWKIPKYAYYSRWFPITKKWLPEFGRPFSINLLWKTSP